MQRASPTADNDYSIDDKDDNSKDQDINTDNTSTNDTDVTDNDSRGARSTVAAVTGRGNSGAGAWATGSGFSKRQAGQSLLRPPLWPGLARLFGPWPWRLLASGPSQQITTSMMICSAITLAGLDSDGVAAVARRSLLIVLTEFNLYPSHMSQRILLTLGRTFIHHYQWGVLVQHLARLSPMRLWTRESMVVITGLEDGAPPCLEERLWSSSPPEAARIPSPVQGPIRSDPDLDFSHDCHGQECYLYGPTVPTTSSQAYNGYYPTPVVPSLRNHPSPAELQPEIPIFPNNDDGFFPAGYPDDPVTPHYPAIAFETTSPPGTPIALGVARRTTFRGGYLILIAQMLSLMTPLPIQSLTQAKTGTRQSGTSGYHLPTSHPPPEKHCDLLTMASSHQAKEAPPTELSPAIRVFIKAPPVLPPVLSQSESVIAAVAEKQHHCLCGISFTQSQVLNRHMKDKHEDKESCAHCSTFKWSEGVLTCTEGTRAKHSELTFSGEPPWSTRKAHVLRARQYKFPNNRSQVVSREPLFLMQAIYARIYALTSNEAAIPFPQLY
ncbi:hypothetical protein EDB84DRAFT_1680853 [Lactarius hengduanensis]|nr:hypothetical protein EDB84DRAFT_1680853 [Lactarius hengduanensis]